MILCEVPYQWQTLCSVTFKAYAALLRASGRRQRPQPRWATKVLQTPYRVLVCMSFLTSLSFFANALSKNFAAPANADDDGTSSASTQCRLHVMHGWPRWVDAVRLYLDMPGKKVPITSPHTGILVSRLRSLRRLGVHPQHQAMMHFGIVA